MKRKFILAAGIIFLSLTLLSACNSTDIGSADSSLKSLSRPYIAQYECTEARLGDTDILKSFEYIKINFLNKEEFELIYKPLNGEKKIFEGKYSLDTSSHEIETDIGVLGHRFKEKTKIENGKFIVSKNLNGKELYVSFEVK